MFKRVTWLGVGLVAGFGTSKWVERKARRRLARYMPASQLKAGAELAGRARDIATGKLTDVRNAVEEGRSAMLAREAELRRQLRLIEPDGAVARAPAVATGRRVAPTGPAGANRAASANRPA